MRKLWVLSKCVKCNLLSKYEKPRFSRTTCQVLYLTWEKFCEKSFEVLADDYVIIIALQSISVYLTLSLLQTSIGREPRNH